MNAIPSIRHAGSAGSLEEWAFGPAPRRATRQVRVGSVLVGGDAPVVVQSMTNTDTADVASTTKQVAELWRAGSELVRVTVNNAESAAAVPRIVEKLAMMGIEVPIVGDFHSRAPAAGRGAGSAEALRVRINPATSASAASAIRSSRNSSICDALRQAGAHRGQLGVAGPSLAAALMDENALRAAPGMPACAARALIRSALDSAARAVELGLERTASC